MSNSKLYRSNPSFTVPDELIIDILSRLPVKSLLRFVVVCRSWYTLINSSYFIFKHLKQSILNPNLNLSSLLVLSQNNVTEGYTMSSYFENALDKPISLDFPFLSNIDYSGIVGVCNGLVCISLREDILGLVICNPATGKFHKIPECKYWDTDCIEYGQIPFGFGFDPSSNDYKLITIMRCPNENDEFDEQAEIYTLSTDSWTVIDTKIPSYDVFLTRDSFASATIDGVFYWAGEKAYPWDPVILSFDMSDDVYRVIEGPKQNQGMWGHLSWELIQLKEELAIFVSTSKRCYTLLVLNENGTCWNEKFKIGPFPTIERPVQDADIGGISVAGFGKNDDLILHDETFVNGDKLFSYNLKSQRITILPFACSIYYFRVFWYTESLLPVKKNDQTQETL